MISKSVQFSENQVGAYYAILWRTLAPVLLFYVGKRRPLFYAVGGSKKGVQKPLRVQRYGKFLTYANKFAKKCTITLAEPVARMRPKRTPHNGQTGTPPEVTAYATLRMGYTRIEPLPGGAHVWQCSHSMRAQLTKGGRKRANKRRSGGYWGCSAGEGVIRLSPSQHQRSGTGHKYASEKDTIQEEKNKTRRK